MSPRLEREAAQDDVMEGSASPEYAQRFGRDHLPDPRPPARFVPTHIAARTESALWLDLPTEGVAFERRMS